MQRTVSLTSTHLHQEQSLPVDNYFMQVDFYCTILGLFENDRMWLGDTFYQFFFITHHPNANEIKEQVHQERLSPVPQDGHNYSNGMLLQHISGISHSLQQSSSKPD